MEKFPMFSNDEHAWAAKHLRKDVIASGIEDEDLNKLGQLFYDRMLHRRHNRSWIPSFHLNLRMSTLPSIELPRPRQVAQVAGFAALTVVLGYINGQGWEYRFNEQTALDRTGALDRLDGILLTGTSLTFLTALGTIGSLTSRKSRRA